jgi:hypothetical protein
MAQRRFLDMMQQYPFWVLDASGFAGNPLFTVFDPVLGFSGCTTPEITVETKEIQRGNWEFKTPVVKSASVSAITLQRGARFYDSDFYNWISGAIRGGPASQAQPGHHPLPGLPAPAVHCVKDRAHSTWAVGGPGRGGAQRIGAGWCAARSHPWESVVLRRVPPCEVQAWGRLRRDLQRRFHHGA